MIQIVLDPFVIAAEACLAVLVYDLIRGLGAGPREDARSDNPSRP